MRKVNGKMIKILSMALAVLTAFTVLLPPIAAFAAYDFSNRGSDVTEVKDSCALLEEHIGSALSEAESEFLKSYSTLVLKYNSIINANKVTLSYEFGVLSVTALEYTYVAENGKRIVWIPNTVKADGKESSFTKDGEVYVAELDTASESDAEIVYRASAEISKQDFNTLLNLHYFTAKYASDMSDYEKKTLAYEKYLYEKRIYDDALAEYNAYLEDYREYEQLKYAYEHYDELMTRYEQDKVKYDEYIDKLATNAEDVKKYEEYEAKLEQIRKQLSAFELLYVKMKDGRDVYSAVMGGTVDQVLGNEGKIIAELGPQYGKIVESAEAATKSLRHLMIEYKELKTEEEKYSFYIVNYKQICDSVFTLAWSLDELYYAPGVKTMMKAFDRHEKYVILVSQLVFASNALIDGAVFTENKNYGNEWRIDNRTYEEVLEIKQYFNDDDTSLPLERGYPVPVPKPDIKEVEKPTIPQKPTSRPIPPSEISAPGNAPVAVEIPDKPNPDIAYAEDIYSELSSEAIALMIADLSNGVIKRRAEIESPKMLYLETKVCKSWNSEQITLTFEIPDNPAGGIGFTHTLVTDKNTPVVYDGNLPEDYTTYDSTYTFSGWKIKSTSSDKKLSEGFSKSETLVPAYTISPKYYNVSWNVGEKTIVESHVAGEIPAPNFVPSVPDDGKCFYEFVGWDREPEVLYRNTSYTAVFVKKFIVPVKDSGADLRIEGDSMICDVSNFDDRIFKISDLIPRIAGKYALTLITEIGTLDFTFTEVIKIAQMDVCSIMVNRSSDESTYTDSAFTLYDSNGDEIGSDLITANVGLLHLLPNTDDTVLKTADEYVKFTSDNEYVTYRAKAGVEYRFIKEYSVLTIKNDLVDIKVNRDTAYTDDVVRFDLIENPGVEIVSVSVTDRDGNSVEFDEVNRAVTVTDRDIIISVKAKYTVHDIVFVSNGIVVSHQELKYGSVPTAPANPTIPDDENYSYTFSGWSPELSSVTADALYEAQFEKTPHADENCSVESEDGFFGRIFKTIFISISNLFSKIGEFFANLFS